MKVFSIAVALAAILFVAYALPQPQEEGEEGGESTDETGEEIETDTTVAPDACEQFQQQCADNESHLGNGDGDHGGNNTMGNTTPSPQCHALQQQCASQNNSTMPGGYTRPTNPEASTPTTMSQPTTVTMPPTPTMPAGRR